MRLAIFLGALISSVLSAVLGGTLALGLGWGLIFGSLALLHLAWAVLKGTEDEFAIEEPE